MGMDTDYLVVGAGASGLAFADTLLAEANVAVTLVDRREAPGGHWQQVYPFVRLHTPSAFYGVNSLALGQDRIDQTGENAGFYERATGEDVREYFAAVAERLTRTARFHVMLFLLAREYTLSPTTSIHGKYSHLSHLRGRLRCSPADGCAMRQRTDGRAGAPVCPGADRVPPRARR